MRTVPAPPLASLAVAPDELPYIIEPLVIASRLFNSAAVVVTAVLPMSSLSCTISIVVPPAVSSLFSEVSHSR